MGRQVLPLRPRHTLGDTAARVLVALVELDRVDGWVSQAMLADRVGKPVTTVSTALWRLRAEGLVTWDDYEPFSLRPLVTEVPFG